MKPITLASIVVAFCCLCMVPRADKPSALRISTFMGDSVLTAESPSISTQGGRLDQCKFYLSNIQWLKAGKMVARAPETHYLVDALKGDFLLPVDVQENEVPDALQLSIGVDSATTYGGVKTGALDPLKGMYWTWHSGYINVKLEGRHPGSPARNGTFQLHLGGFRQPYATLQTLRFPLSAGQLHLKLQLQPLLSQHPFATKANIMTPGADAARLAEQFAQAFQPMSP